MVISVIYPNHDGARFDLDYYVQQHGALVAEILKPDRTTLVAGVAAPGAPAAPYAMIAHFHFDTAEAMQTALASPRMGELQADVPNFTDIVPTLMIGRDAA